MPSSLITVLARPCGDAAAPCPPVEARELASLSHVPAAVPDPRRARGRRCQIGARLALCLTAVPGGARSLAQITRYAADVDPEVRAELGLNRAAPSAPTLGRLLARIDGDAPGRRGRRLARPSCRAEFTTTQIDKDIDSATRLQADVYVMASPTEIPDDSKDYATEQAKANNLEIIILGRGDVWVQEPHLRPPRDQQDPPPP